MRNYSEKLVGEINVEFSQKNWWKFWRRIGEEIGEKANREMSEEMCEGELVGIM